MGFLEIFLKVFRNLIDLLMSWFFNTSSNHDGGDENQANRAITSATPPKQNYEVFLSFRGKDTRYSFTDHLYLGLEKRGIKVFRDNEELHVGEMIHQLFEAIKASNISIPIISSDYASSIWCLKELLQILECKQMSDQLVLPIFYHVKPSDIREQKGDFGKSFRLCKKNHNLEGKFVQKLENAFTEVATMKGWEVNETENRYEGELVEEVVTIIFNELRKGYLIVPNFLVGVEDRVKRVKQMIDAKPPTDAKIIGIHGMRGMGKTTLAKALYNALCNDFKCRSFVPNIREASKLNKGMEALQKQIISDILVYKSPQEISHVDEGITIIEERFKAKKVLLLLDDIEDKDQLSRLVGKDSWFGPESIVIITTRNKDVTVASTINLSYELNELNNDQSYELFCKHAFGKDASCPREMETIAREIISTTGGLPLAVEIIGSLLFQKNKDIWKETLEKLRRIPNKNVHDRLKISYDYLEHEEKQIFLDITCLPIKDEPEFASYMWESCGFYPRVGIEKLMSLSLIKRNANGIIIHDQLRDLGREIVRNEGLDNIGQRSRICSDEEAIEVMERKEGIDKLQALILQTSHDDYPYEEKQEKLHYRSEDFKDMTNLRFLRMGDVHLIGNFENLFPRLKWLYWGLPSCHSCIDLMGINFNPKKLVILELFDSNITEHWKGWSHMEHLKVIKLKRCVNLTTTPNVSALKGLEVLILFDCKGLKKIHSSIAKFKETLVIITTGNKDATIASAVNLSYQFNELNMDQSYELFCKHAFRRDTSCPRELETLAWKIISKTGGYPLVVEVIGSLLCKRDKDYWKAILEELMRLPHENVQDKLKISFDYLHYEERHIFLDIACLFKNELNYAFYMWDSCGFYPRVRIRLLTRLSLIKWDHGLNTVTMHDQLRDLGKKIVRSEGGDNIGLRSRIWLEEEAVEVMERKQGTRMIEVLVLPTFANYRSEDFEGMTELRFLRMGEVHLTGDFKNHFPNLRWLRWGPRCYDVHTCIDIMGINFYPRKLVVLELFDSNITEHWRGWSRTQCLKVIKLNKCMNLTTTPDFSAWGLEVLILEDCHGLKKIHPSIGKFKKTLQVLKATGCHEDLRELPIELGQMEELKELDISYNRSIKAIPIFEGYMTKLETLEARSCDSLLYIPDSLGSLVKLQRLNLSETGVKELPDSIGELCNLESLQMEKTPIKFLPASIGRLSKLRQLDLWGCKELTNLPILPTVMIRYDPLQEESTSE